MRRFLILSLSFLACSDDGGPSTGSDSGADAVDVALDPAESDAERPDSGMDVGDIPDPDAADSGGADTEDAAPISPETESRIESSGACTNDIDAPFLDDPNLENVSVCRSLCETESCAAGCLRDLNGVTAVCASCFLGRAACSEQNCGADICETSECRECSERLCEPEFGICAGALGEVEESRPSLVCLPTGRDVDLSSAQFADIANECSDRCGQGACVGECLVEETDLELGCSGCFADWWDCSSDECRGACDTQFSNQCLDCGGYAECRLDLLRCLAIEEVRFADPAVVSAAIRASVLAERPHIAVIEPETGAPVLRRLQEAQVTGFLEVGLRSGTSLGVTNGNIGARAEVLAHVVGEVVPERDHTLTIYEAGGELHGSLVEEPRLASPTIRVFNGFDEPASISVVDSDISWELGAHELGEAESLLTPTTLVVGEHHFDVPGLGPSAAILLYFIEHADGPRARATTSAGGFADMIGVVR